MAFSSSLESPSSLNNFFVTQVYVTPKRQDNAAGRKRRGVSATNLESAPRRDSYHALSLSFHPLYVHRSCYLSNRPPLQLILKGSWNPAQPMGRLRIPKV